jgi:glycosyltransferase involved in cell wall biosynthesis
MRIAFFSFSIAPFAPNDLLYFRAAGMALEKGHDVLVSAFDWGEQTAPEYKDIAKRGAILQFRRRDARHQNFLIRQLKKLQHKISDPLRQLQFIERFAPDVIVISDSATYHFVGEPTFPEYILSKGIPSVTISQYNDEVYSLRDDHFDLARKFFSAASSCVFVSQRNLDKARIQLCLPLDNGVVLDNPPNLTVLEQEQFPQPDEAAMAMVARLDCVVKGQSVIMEILAREPWRARKWKLNLYGKGPDERYLRELIRYLDLEDRVFLRGHVGNIREVWAENEILLMCSAAEGKPLALTEAMVCGRPAVVTDVGGNAELIEDGITGFVAESAAPGSFAKALERAWEQRGCWKEMGSRAHTNIVGRLTPPPEHQLLSIIESSGSSRNGKYGP